MLSQMTTLGLLNVITHLEENGYPSRHVYLCKRRGRQQQSHQELTAILDFIEQQRPDLIGLTLMTLDFFRTRELTVEIKKRFPGTPVLWGGIHPTCEPEESIKYADYLCLGEGEDTVLEMVRVLEEGGVAADIPNVWMKKDGRVTTNDVRPLIQDLDMYPFPRINWSDTYCMDKGAIKLLTHRLYRKHMHYNGTMYDVIISRGCPFSCSYCCNSLFRKLYKNKGKYVRYRSVDSAIAEMKYIVKTFPYTRIINIQDDSFAAAPERYLEEFSEKYRSEVGLPLRLRALATQLDEARIRYLARANAMSVVVGIQANDRINREVFNRKVSSQQILDVARLIKKYNIIGEFQLIGSNPYATENDMLEIAGLLAEIPKPYRLQIFNLGMFPNTALRDKAIRDGIKVNEMDGYMYSYGDYPEKFPLLRGIHEIAPQTPGFLIRFFLRNRNSSWCRLLLGVYRVLLVDNLVRLKSIIIRSSFLVLAARKVLFLWTGLTKACRKAWAAR